MTPVLNACASEGLLYAALYYCNAEVVNQMVVRICSAKHPQWAPRSEKAFAVWSSRFGARAVLAAKKCETEFEKGAVADESAKYQSKLTEIRSKWLSDIEASLTSEAASTCEAALSGLENASKLEEHLWKE